MDDILLLNPLAQRVRAVLIAEYPQWVDCCSSYGEGDLEVAIPAPVGSKAGHLVIFTKAGESLWIRFSPPHMCYSVENEAEMLTVIRLLQDETALFVVTMSGDEWVQTTLVERSGALELNTNETVHVVSWSGNYDRTVGANTIA